MKTKITKIKNHVVRNKLIYISIKVFVVLVLVTALCLQIFSLTKENNNKKPVNTKNLLEEKLNYLFDANYRRIISIQMHSKNNQIPALLTCAVIFAESENKAIATSYVYARGLMQIMHNTAISLTAAIGEKELSQKIRKNPAMLYEPELNIRLGTKFLNALRKTHNSWEDTLHSYNVGPFAFKKGARNYAYVNKIMRFYNDWKTMSLADIHKKYGEYLSSLYNKKMTLVAMR